MTAFVFLLAFLGSSTPSGVLTAVRVDERPSIDGILDEQVWQMAELESCTMWQYGPDFGSPMTEDTDIYILYDDNCLYFGFLMHDPDPHSMMDALTPRDNYITGEWIAILLDTWNDGRQASSFEISLANSQMESKISPHGNWDYSWDAVWESGTSRVPEGWSAEFAIPFSCLRFSSANHEQTWGINFQRILSRTSENGWYMLTESRQMADLNGFATLNGIRNISGSMGAEIRPYASGRTFHTDIDDECDNSLDAGVDLKLGLSSSIAADFTLNPDFGQVEADAVEMNLSHFELFLNEKRPFFLESRNIFEMPFNMFYSRRIGSVASNGDVIPILGGAKISGSFGDNFRFGFLDAVTSRVRENDTTLVDAAANYGIFRGYRQFGSHSFLGVSAVSKQSWEQENHEADYSNAAAIDGAIEIPANHLVSFEAARSWNTGLKDSGAYEFNFEKIRSSFGYDAGCSYTDEDFNVNTTGFTTETGCCNAWGSIGINLRPEETFSEINVWTGAYYSRQTNGEITGRNIHLDSHASLKNGLNFGMDLSFSGDRFDPYEGPVGHFYDGCFDFFANVGTSSFDPFSLWGGIGGGQWESGGTFGNYIARVRFRPSASLDTSLEGRLFNTRDSDNYNWEIEAFDNRSTDWKSMILRMNYMFNPYVNLRLFSQYSEFVMDFEQSDRIENSELTANMLFSWQYRPGSMIYLLAESLFEADSNGDFHYPDFGFYTKLTWYLSI